MSHAERSTDFLREMVRADVAAKKHGGDVVTRFPPEPNGYLHIGHVKAICIDFGIAREHHGRCHLRMDDTNPTTETMEYVEAIKRDVRWLGFDWGEHLYFASDYFERFYELAERLIVLGRAYVCDLPDEVFSTQYRGTITEHGKPSPYRERSVDENLNLFRRMRAGEFKDGERVLRAKIDMTSPNMKMRDPPLVRIKHAHHYRTKDAWCIYPLYDYAHCLEDSFERVTHSLCTLEFESARELYDWVIAATEVPHVPRQTEFARLNITYMVMSKRKLLQLVEGKYVSGWDDPRMPTVAGLRRRGYTPEALREFVARVGVSKNISTVDIALLEHTVREDLDRRSPRVMAVQRPVELVVDTFDEALVEWIDAPYWPEGTDPAPGVTAGSRKVPFSRVLWVERDDVTDTPPKGWHRLAPGRTVRLRHGYIVTCTGIEKNDAGEIVRVHCTHDPNTRGGSAPEGLRVEGTLHWVSAAHAVDVESRVYDRLFVAEHPGTNDADFLTQLNPASLTVMRAKAEPALASAKAGERFQFERVGFFFVDDDSSPGALIFNRTVALKDSWQKAVTKAAPQVAKPAPSAKPRVERPAVGLPELSAEAVALADKFQVPAETCRILVQEPMLLSLFEAAMAVPCPPELRKPIASLLVNDVLGELRSRKLSAVGFSGAALVELVAMLHAATISNAQAKEVLSEMFASGADPGSVVKARGLLQLQTADALLPAVEQVLTEHADVVARYKAGNANVLGALVGMVMRQTGGRANAKAVKDVLEQAIAKR